MKGLTFFFFLENDFFFLSTVIFSSSEKWKKKTILNMTVIIQTQNSMHTKAGSKMMILSLLYIALFSDETVSPSPILIVINPPFSIPIQYVQ